MNLREKLRPFNPHLPLSEAKTIPKLWYLDPEIAELERKAVFGNTWQPVARVGQLCRPDSFVTGEVAGEPLLLVRDDTGRFFRAFSNVCRHKATVIETAQEGCKKLFFCPYHRWAYNHSGKLHSAPEMEGVEGFCKEDVCLPSFHTGWWGQFLWAHMGAGPPDLWAYLGPLAELDAVVSGLCFTERREYEVACNWKVYMDNYLDGGYHVPTVHPALASALDYSRYRTDVFEHCNVQRSPMAESSDPALKDVRKGKEAQYWWVWPNFMLNLYEGVMDTNLVLPLGPDRCKVIFDFFFEVSTDREFIQKSIAVAEQVQQEDIRICESVQKGLHSNTYDTGRYSVRREAGVHHFHQLLGRSLHAGLDS